MQVRAARTEGGMRVTCGACRSELGLRDEGHPMFDQLNGFLAVHRRCRKGRGRPATRHREMAS
jgi:hypothetical protein